jgi:Terminase large subunit, T4likevirus-type, N-terminal
MTVSLKPPQSEVFTCGSRFRIVVAGRRFGKTYLALIELIRAAWGPGRLVWYIAPTYKQAKRIAWKLLKKLTRPYWASKPNETDLSIELAGGGTIALRGADNYDSLRGDGLDFVVLDEFASMSSALWPEIVRPSLSDRQGRALFTGTPHGFNHFYDLVQIAQGRQDWATFQFTTEQGGNVPVWELEQAADEMDERTWRQEFRASFETSGQGLVYYAFDRSQNVRSLDYDPRYPLCWSLDFNVNPMCSVIGQNIGDEIHVVDEMILMQSNTERLASSSSKGQNCGL